MAKTNWRFYERCCNTLEEINDQIAHERELIDIHQQRLPLETRPSAIKHRQDEIERITDIIRYLESKKQ